MRVSNSDATTEPGHMQTTQIRSREMPAFDAELTALAEIVQTFQALPAEARGRVFRYIGSKYGVTT